MSHEKRIFHCSGPHDVHALHGISMRPRTGDLDVICPDCAGHGEWNAEIDLASQRSKRQFCGGCDGRGWIETGDDPVPEHDIVHAPGGHPQWIVRMASPDRADAKTGDEGSSIPRRRNMR